MWNCRPVCWCIHLSPGCYGDPHGLLRINDWPQGQDMVICSASHHSNLHQPPKKMEETNINKYILPLSYQNGHRFFSVPFFVDPNQKASPSPAARVRAWLEAASAWPHELQQTFDGRLMFQDISTNYWWYGITEYYWYVMCFFHDIWWYGLDAWN